MLAKTLHVNLGYFHTHREAWDGRFPLSLVEVHVVDVEMLEHPVAFTHWVDWNGPQA